MIQTASSQGQRVPKHRRWLPSLGSGMRHQVCLAGASNFQEFQK
jgi:hypothetical protein